MRVRPLQSVCSPACGLAKARADRERKESKELREAKAKSKRRSEWLKEAQAAFNGYIRERDAHLSCVSCGRMHGGQWHAGHYLTTGARPNLRFDPQNVHRQCQPCNTHLHGNIALYRKQLIEIIGLADVERLEADHTPRHYSVDDLAQIKKHYGALARKLKRERENG